MMLSYKDVFLYLNVLGSSTEKYHYCMKQGEVAKGGPPWVAKEEEKLRKWNEEIALTHKSNI